MERSNDTEERAGTWLARRESGNWSAEDEARFAQWLTESTANRVAFLRQEAAWEHALRLQALKGRTPTGAVPSTEHWRLSRFVSDGTTEPRADDRDEWATTDGRPHDRDERAPLDGQPHDRDPRARRASRWRHGVVAAGLVLAVAGALGGYLWSARPDYQTPVGGLASVPMSDGSKVTLNTDSAIRMAVTETERRVELERGEAFFEVARDPTRPFIVSAGDKRIVVIGTKFSVRRSGDEIRVLVTEGKVRLEGNSRLALPRAPSSREPETAGPTRDDTSAVLLAAGTLARAGDAGVVVQEKPLPEVEADLSWRSGYLTFRDIPLAEAVAEFNRYNERKILIEDPAVGAIRFSGKVRPASSEGFVRLLEEVFPIHAQHVNGRIVLNGAEPPR